MDKLGKVFKDKVTGFQGTVTSKVVCLFGCNQYGLTPPAKDGKVEHASYFDEGSIEFIEDNVQLSPELLDKVITFDNDDILGKKVRDVISDFEGIVTLKIFELFGDTMYQVAPKSKENSKDDSHTFHKDQVEIVDNGIKKEDVQSVKPGGPNKDLNNYRPNKI